jgi:glutamyl-tRNA synthetase
VTDVVRGDDLLASAARQQVIAAHLGIQHARWWHLPLVHGPDGKRLAKRHGSHSLASLRAAGIAPERLVGWCAWSLGLTPSRATLSARELVTLASPETLRTAARSARLRPTVFTDADLGWLHGA